MSREIKPITTIDGVLSISFRQDVGTIIARQLRGKAHALLTSCNDASIRVAGPLPGASKTACDRPPLPHFELSPRFV